MVRDEAEAWKRLLRIRDSNKPLPVPNLIGVGASRCGTTALYHALKRCPDVFMAPVKEIGYFAPDFENWAEREYLLFFEGSEMARWRGEITPHYMHDPEAPERIRALNPDCRIIVQLRMPHERFVSLYHKHRDQHRIDRLETYVDLALGAEGKHPDRNFRQSLYLDALERWTATFPGNVRVIHHEDLAADPDRIARGLADWLGIEPPRFAARPETSVGEIDERLAEMFDRDYAETLAFLGRQNIVL